MTEAIRTLLTATLTVSLTLSPLILLLLLGRRPMQSLRASTRYLLWLLILARLSIPLILPALPSAILLTPPPAEVVTVPPTPADAPAPLPAEVSAPTASAPTATRQPDPATADPAPPAPRFILDPVRLLTGLWLGVALITLVARLSRALALNRTLVRMGQPIETAAPDLVPIAEAACAEMGFAAPPPIRILPASGTPMAVGLIRSTVLLPAAITAEELPRILTHELTHIRRRDIPLRLLSMLALSLHWFNPLAYLAARRCEAECELSCDELVLAGCDLEARQAYGHTLLAVLRDNTANSRRAAGLSTRFRPSKGTIRARFLSILDTTPKRIGRGAIAAVLAVCLCVGSLLACRFEAEVEENVDRLIDLATPVTPAKPKPKPTVSEGPLSLTFVPLEPKPAQTLPLDGTLPRLPATARFSGGLAIASGRGGKTVLLATAAENTDAVQVCLPEGVIPREIVLGHLGYKEYLACVCSADRIDAYLWQDGALYHAFTAQGELIVDDLNLDGLDDYLCDLQGEPVLYTIVNDTLCAASIADAVAAYSPGATCSLDYDESRRCMSLYLQLPDRSGEHLRIFYATDRLHISDRERLPAMPSLRGSFFLWGQCSYHHNADAALHIADGRYTLCYSDNYIWADHGNTLFVATGEVSVTEDSFTLEPGPEGVPFPCTYRWDATRHHFTGTPIGDFRPSDRFTVSTYTVYNTVARQYRNAITGHADDPLTTGKIALRYVALEGDILHLRLDNGYTEPLTLAEPLTLEHRAADYTWETNEPRTPIPAFPADTVIHPGEHLALTLDLANYGHLDPNGYYHAVLTLHYPDGCPLVRAAAFDFLGCAGLAVATP